MSIVTKLQFKKRPKPSKISDLMEVIRRHLDEGRYLDTRHATQRGWERGITRPEILQVLRRGYHDKSRDRFDENFGAWNYAVKGKTVDLRSLRIIVSIDPSGMLIITAIDLEK